MAGKGRLIQFLQRTTDGSEVLRRATCCLGPGNHAGPVLSVRPDVARGAEEKMGVCSQSRWYEVQSIPRVDYQAPKGGVWPAFCHYFDVRCGFSVCHRPEQLVWRAYCVAS